MFKAVLIVFPVEAAKVKTLSRFFALFCIFYGQLASIPLMTRLRTTSTTGSMVWKSTCRELQTGS